jgi:hypothetical protein
VQELKNQIADLTHVVHLCATKLAVSKDSDLSASNMNPIASIQGSAFLKPALNCSKADNTGGKSIGAKTILQHEHKQEKDRAHTGRRFENVQWLLLDPDGNESGPHPNEHMASWFGEFVLPTDKVRQADRPDDKFTEIKMIPCGPNDNPFLQ